MSLYILATDLPGEYDEFNVFFDISKPFPFLKLLSIQF